MQFFDEWLDDHDYTTVVRLTTLAYHFCVDSDQDAVDKFRDWTGYQDTVCIEALGDFEKRFGYALTAEDFVDQGFYNATYRIPSKAYRDWMAFIQDFTVTFGKALVDKVHAAGKKAAIFWGDHWIGAEFYHSSCQEIGIDINIGAVEDGVALRRLSDTPGCQVKEIRLYPYFFPDVFNAEGDPTGESLGNWMKIRRALLRMPVDRIGFGGYLSLAARFPDFVAHVEQLCAEFREIRERTGGGLSQRLPIKVAVLNSWGWLRAWVNYTNPHQKFLVKRPDITLIAGSNMLECLAGLPVEVSFISFEELREGGIPSDINVLINAGTGDTAWSGGREWVDPAIIATVREWVARGGGFLGITDPSGHQHQGRYIQLEDVLGVQKEVGQSCMVAPRPRKLVEAHFITEGIPKEIRLGTGLSFVYPASDDAELISISDGGHIQLSANRFAEGRGVYISELPYNLYNARLLLRAIAWAAGQEKCLETLITDNPNTDCAYYPNSGSMAIANHTAEPQAAGFTDMKGVRHDLELEPHELTWLQAGGKMDGDNTMNLGMENK
jgi:1,3-beta-galactosyl-N-acetylhexosamine phosphorylase